MWQPSRNSKRQEGATRQVPHCRPTHIRSQHRCELGVRAGHIPLQNFFYLRLSFWIRTWRVANKNYKYFLSDYLGSVKTEWEREKREKSAFQRIFPLFLNWRCVRRMTAATRLMKLWVRIPPTTWMSVVSVVCCQVQVSAETSWSLVQRSPTECGASLCVIQKPREWGSPGPMGAVGPNKKERNTHAEVPPPQPSMSLATTGTKVRNLVDRTTWRPRFVPSCS
jgi:hypothetical protein